MNITTDPSNSENYQIYFTQTNNEMLLQAKIAEQREAEKFITNVIKFKIETRRLFEYLELQINNPNIQVETIIKKVFQNVLKSFPVTEITQYEWIGFLNDVLDNNGYLNANEWIGNIPNAIISAGSLTTAVYAGFTNYEINVMSPLFTQRTVILSLFRINRDRTFNSEGQKNITIDVDDITKQNNWLANVFPMQVPFLNNMLGLDIMININAFPQNNRVESVFTVTSAETPVRPPEYVWFGEGDNKVYAQTKLTY